MAKMNQIIPPENTELPLSDIKEERLYRINKYLVDTYQLPLLYRYIPISVYELANIVNDTIFLSSAKSMNDVSEGAFYIRDTLKDISKEQQEMQKNIFLKSFSCSPNNILLWSHYADSHKGICIAYDFSKLTDDSAKWHLYPVQYSDAQFSCGEDQSVINSPYLYLRKSTVWEYEQELRLLYRKADLPYGSQLMKLECISEIHLGWRMEPEIKKMIRDLVNKKNQAGHNIALFEVTPTQGSFQLQSNRLDSQNYNICSTNIK